jgi:hypothetical protein
MIRSTDTAQPSGSSTANKPLAFVNPAFQQWMTAVAPLPAEKQVDAVVKKLQELNPGFDGKVTGDNGQGTPQIDNGVVTGIGFSTENVTDISPVRAFQRLRTLSCGGPAKSMLSDLSPLKGMPLVLLGCDWTPVSDLSPLKGMPLTYLHISCTRISDLSPLKGMPLTHLFCQGVPVADLSPLHGMALKHLDCGGTKVSDLSPLKGMPLAVLDFPGTRTADLSPLKGMPLACLVCSDTPVSDLLPLEGMNLESIVFTPKNITKGLDVIRQMRSLKTIGIGSDARDKSPPAEFWKKYDAGEFNK